MQEQRKVAPFPCQPSAGLRIMIIIAPCQKLIAVIFIRFTRISTEKRKDKKMIVAEKMNEEGATMCGICAQL